MKHYRFCDHLVANTRGIANYLVAQGWARDRVHYLPNFPQAETAQPAPRARFLTPENVKLALALGRLHPAKGFDALLDALAQASGIFLWLAGDGPERGALEQRASALGLLDRVRFLGWRDDAPALLAACDFLVSSSRREPLGNTVIEAWAARKPVLATDTDGPGELIAPGETGLLVPAGDVAALAQGMMRLASDADLRARLAQAGHVRYQAQFGAGRVVEAYRDFFARVAA